MRKDGTIPTCFVCSNSKRVVRDAQHGRLCTPHQVYCETLDAAVWARVEALLRDPRTVAQEVERTRAIDPPGMADLAALDARLLALTRKKDSLKETAGYATDSETRRDLAGQIDLHVRQKRQTEAARADRTASRQLGRRARAA
jgi:hypothetical protein